MIFDNEGFAQTDPDRLNALDQAVKTLAGGQWTQGAPLVVEYAVS